MGLFDVTGLKKSKRRADVTLPRDRAAPRQSTRSSRARTSQADSGEERRRPGDVDPFARTIARLAAAKARKKADIPTRPLNIDELQKLLSRRGLAPLPTPPTSSSGGPRRTVRTTTERRRAASAGQGGAAPTASMTRAGVPTAQLGTLFGSPLNIPARVQQSLTGRQLTGGLFDILNAGRSAGISFPSATTFRRLSPSERRASQDAARLKGFSAEEFQAGILRSSPGDRPRPSINIAPRRSRVRV